MIIEREVIKEVMQFGSVKKMMSEGLRYVEIFYDGVTREFVWGNGRILGLFSDFSQYNDYVFGGKKGEYFYFYKEDGEPYSPHGYTDWQTVGRQEINKKWHPHILDGSDAFLARDEYGDWVFIFQDGSLIDENEVWDFRNY